MLETCLMWTLKAWVEWGVPWNWAGRQGGWDVGPHLTPGGDVRCWGLAQACHRVYREGGPGKADPLGDLQACP